MSWVQIVGGVGGLYYSVRLGHFLLEWLTDDYDIARRITDRQEQRRSGNYGLLGFQAGLIYDQRVDEEYWRTRIPWEFHLRRKLPDPSKRVTLTVAEAESLGLQPGTYYKIGGRFIAPPQEIDMLLVLEWWNSGSGTRMGRHAIPIKGKADFVEVTIESMLAENQASGGTQVVVLEHLSANAPEVRRTIADQHPKYLDIFEPITSMSYDDLLTSGLFVFDTLYLRWKADLIPGPGFTIRNMREWFDMEEPQSVVLGPIEPVKAQQITYDYW